MESTLHLHINGDDLHALNNLLDTLTLLGINIQRPDSEALQEQYANSLISHYQLDIPGNTVQQVASHQERRKKKERLLKSRLGWTDMPRWETHHQILAGRCVFYLPQTEGRQKPADSHPDIIHELNFLASGCPERDNIIERLIHTGGTSTSITERIRLVVANT